MATPVFDLFSAPTSVNPNGPGTWADYEIVTRLERDKHRYMMGISSPGGFYSSAAAFVQLASDTVIMTVEWRASCFDDVPWIPDPTKVGSNWILLDDWLSGPAPTVADDGVTPLYALEGLYVYGCVNPSSMTYQDFVIPRYPWLQDVFSRVIPPTSLQGGIIQTVSSTPINKPILGGGIPIRKPPGGNTPITKPIP